MNKRQIKQKGIILLDRVVELAIASMPIERKKSPSKTPIFKEPQGRFSSEPVGYLLGKPGLIALIAGLLLAAWNRQVAIVILLGLILAAAGLAKLWSQLSLVGVSFQRTLSERRAFPGEQVELKLQLINRKLLPLPWIQLDDEVPLEFASGVSHSQWNKSGFGFLSRATAMLWYTEVSWRCHLHCKKRGYYPLGPLTVASGDIFGLYPRSSTKQEIEHLIVYPRIFPVTQLGIPSLYPLGEIKAEQRIFEDPTRTIGVRDYTPRDSLRYVHWKATARHQNLQVKVFEPTTTLKVAMFLAVDSFQQDGTLDEENFELGISTTASIANYILEQRNSVGLFVNSCLTDSKQPAEIPPGSSSGQLVNILEALAKVTPTPSSSFEDFLQSERGSLPWGTTIIIILFQVTPSLTNLLTILKESGHKLLVLQIGGEKANDTDHNTAWHNAAHSDELAIVGSVESR